MINDFKPGRFYLIIFFFILLYLFLIVNLYMLQIQQSSFFKDLGEKQYNVTMQNFPQRALIYDCKKRLVAVNKDTLAAFILPKTMTQQKETLLFLQKYFNAAYQRFSQYEHKSFMFVKRNLTQDDIDLINQHGTVDIHTLKESGRFYPYQALGPIVGITDIDNQGQFGLEAQYNKRLQGLPTTYQLKKDAKSHHFYFDKETKFQGKEGEDLYLTIDADLQFACQKILENTVNKHQSTEAGALIIDPITGEILTAVSAPIFDPNNIKNLDMEDTKCRPFVQCFESGSVLKIFGALAALQEGVVSIDEEIDCLNSKDTKLDNLRIRTVYPDGVISFLRIMQRSNNIGIVKVAKRIGTDLYDYYKMLGFGEYTGLQFPGEQKGFLNHPDNWSAYSIQSLAYGYEITISLLQLARAFSVIFNGGYLITPHLLQGETVVNSGPLISQKTIQDLQTILESVVQDGSAKTAAIAGYKVYGKTGTANILVDGVYDDNHHFYSFAGAIEIDKKMYVICCYVKDSLKATYGSMITAPLFKELAQALILNIKLGQ